MADEKRAPVQMSPKLRKPPGTVSWTEHCEAWEAYAKRHGRDQSAERMAERCGFSYCELVALLGREPSTWKPVYVPSVGSKDARVTFGPLKVGSLVYGAGGNASLPPMTRDKVEAMERAR